MNNSRNMEQVGSSSLTIYMSQVYQWMTVGLALTAVVAWYVASTPALINLVLTSKVMFFGLIALMLGLPIGLQMMLPRLSAFAATSMFLAYSAVMGVSLSSILIAYTQASIFSTFITTAGTFAAMSIYGMTTKRDLTSMGSFLSMGLIGIIIAMVVNIFLQSSALEFVISGLGVIIFTGLTAYDTQKLKAMGENAPLGDSAVLRRGVILGALTLYLDFINLFLMLLRFMGDRR